ncbi:MAG: glycosyltransferase [Chitinophagaceae bacterium]|nr:glycosyltransferase [Chitinophagaceae bacterium]
MKILLAHKFFKYTGGADVFFLEVGRALEENGHEVAYFSTIDEDTLPSKYSKYFIKAPDFKSHNSLKKVLSILEIPYNFKAKNNFEKLIRDFKPDVIHAFGIGTHISPSIFDIGKKNEIPIVWSLNDYKHICPNYKLFHHGKLCEDCKGNKFYKCISNRCSHDSLTYSVASSIESYIHNSLNIYKKNVDLFLFASDFMAFKTEEFWGVNSFKWGKLLNPFKIPEIPVDEEVGGFGLYFGRLIDEKGVDVLINALTFIPDYPFKIVGDGPDLEKLKLMAKDYDLKNIEFVGPLWGDELNKLLYSSRFVVVPSIWHENFPYVILQAFAAGKPVIGSNRGGIPEMISNRERGLVYDAKDPKLLSENIHELWENEKLIKEYGSNARNYVLENFNDKVFYDQLIFNYNKVLK